MEINSNGCFPGSHFCYPPLPGTVPWDPMTFESMKKLDTVEVPRFNGGDMFPRSMEGSQKSLGCNSSLDPKGSKLWDVCGNWKLKERLEVEKNPVNCCELRILPRCFSDV